MANYIGFSTIGQTKKFTLSDIDLVIRDILNNFNIRKGEKLMNPNYGTIIWNLLFENFTEDVKSAMVKDIQTIAGNDPRVSLSNIVVTQFNKGIQLAITLTYIPTNQTANMLLSFYNENQQLFSTVTTI
jgi:phage baseplate assembly protein W